MIIIIIVILENGTYGARSKLWSEGPQLFMVETSLKRAPSFKFLLTKVGATNCSPNCKQRGKLKNTGNNSDFLQFLTGDSS